ncbi:MAG: nicotinate-nucleotide diphosphorylase (carboxylating), partial [Ectothiorhodospiraceae bacterium]|nr:nicotinate-nucleotide diphosphorylase (carboxylating) [Ectothiorhodospiraceae bacterium]
MTNYRNNPVLENPAMLSVIEAALREDIGVGDITSNSIIPEDLHGEGTFLAKANGVLSGLDVAAAVFQILDERIEIEASIEDGMPVVTGTKIARLHGPYRSILTGERLALNFMQRMSGIASMAAAFVKLTEGLDVRIMDTRKTAPGLRAFDKLAVTHGRGVNHRYGLDDMVLIKDNHIAVAGGLTEAVNRAAEQVPAGSQIKIEVETDTLEQVHEALSCERVDVIMLDNFELTAMREA